MSKEIKEKILEKLEGKTDEEIEKEFVDIIREQLDENKFWDWVSGWLDGDFVCEIAENWDIETKREEIKLLKEKFLK
jgi:hypothetical protein